MEEESSASFVDTEQFIHLPNLNESLETLDEDEELVRPSFVNVSLVRWLLTRVVANKLAKLKKKLKIVFIHSRETILSQIGIRSLILSLMLSSIALKHNLCYKGRLI